MIIYQGMKTNHKLKFICFSNESGETVEVPIETVAAERIIKYLDRIALAPKLAIEHEEEEVLELGESGS